MRCSRRGLTRVYGLVMVAGFGLTVLSGCGSVSGPAPPATPEGSSGGPASAPSKPPAPTAGWTITKTNVGLGPERLTCKELPEYHGPLAVPSGTTISQKRVTHGLDLSAGNITIERSCIQPTEAGQGMPVVGTTNYNTGKVTPAKVTIRDSEIDGSLLGRKAAAQATGFIGVADLIGNYIHDLGSGIGLMNTGSTLDVLVEHNYVTGLLAWGDASADGTHSDAFTVRDFDLTTRPARKLIVRSNRFDCDSPAATGALFVQTYAGPIKNVLVEKNLLEGGGYQLGLNQTKYPYSDLRAIDNRFTGTGWGPAYVQGGDGWSQWKDNYRYSSANPDARGASINEP